MLRWVQWVFTAWLIVVSFRFCITVYNAAENPIAPGYDIHWLVGWLFTAAIVLITYALPSRFPNRVWAVLIALTFGGVLALTGVIPFLLAGLLTAVCIGIGFRFVPKGDTLTQIVCGLPIGFALLALAVLALGWLEFLTQPVIWSLVAGATVIAFQPVLQLSSEITSALRRVEVNREDGILCTIIALSMLWNATWAVAPEIQFDALNYHLTMPQTYLQHGAIVEGHYFHAYFARTVECFLVLCLALGGVETAKLWIYLTSIAVIIATFVMGRVLISARVGLWAAAFLATTPLFGWESGTVYIDNVLTLLVTASLIAFVCWHERQDFRWLYVLAAIAAAAVGSKPNAAFLYVLLAPWVLVCLIRARQFAPLAVATLIAAVVCIPSYAVIYHFTGNPVFPLFNGVFESPKWFSDNTIMNTADFGIGSDLGALTRFPFRLVWDTDRFGEVMPRGALGIALLYAFPFAVFLRIHRNSTLRILLTASAAYLVIVFLTMQYARYYLPLHALICVLGCAAVLQLSRHEVLARFCLLSVLIFQPLVNAAQYWNLTERFPVKWIAGSENRESFLRRALPGYASAQFLNRVVPDGARVISDSTDHLRFYVRAPIDTPSLVLRGDPLRAIENVNSAEETAQLLKSVGYSHLFIHHDRLGAAWPPYLQPAFLNAYTTIEFSDEATIVYRLRD